MTTIRRTRLHRLLHRPAAGIAALAVVSSLVGCGLTIPTDPHGTLNRVTGGDLRVGTSPDAGLVTVANSEPRGSIVDLVDDLADSIDAEPTWTVASEETLVTMLEDGELDLVAGGLTTETPWVDRAGVSRGYPGMDGADGRELVMLVPLGENAWLSTVEAFLDEQVGS